MTGQIVETFSNIKFNENLISFSRNISGKATSKDGRMERANRKLPTDTQGSQKIWWKKTELY